MTEVEKKIRSVIAERGIIPFSEFMALALYCPEYGYYERERDMIGTAGDYYTSVSVGPVFGHLLAFQFAEWLREDSARGLDHPMVLIESGAHDGRLARDILEWLLAERPEIATRLRYFILEPSSGRVQWQKRHLQNLAARIEWAPNLAALPLEFSSAIIFSNELLDALPVRRFQWSQSERAWHEVGVALVAGSFTWRKLERVNLDHVLAVSPTAEHVLPDGFILDLTDEATRWWGRAAAWLRSGRLLAIDYGYTAEELFARPGGTLRGYHQHHSASDVLMYPGEQDLTAHVAFSELIHVGEAAGLRTEFFGTQGQFLTGLVSRFPAASNWNERLRRQFLTLTHPEHLGSRFRILCQKRN